MKAQLVKADLPVSPGNRMEDMGTAAPDFIIPNEFNPQIVIEAKITEDDGTLKKNR